MPVFSLGGMRYQHKWQDVPLAEVPEENQANLEATVRRALSLGINHVETARGYGSSERQLGLVLPRLPRDEITVQTKVPPHADPAVFVDHVHESLDRLRVPYVDLLGIHGINNHETLWWAVRKGGCLAAARRLVAQGKVRHVGFSTHGPPDVIEAAIDHEADGGFEYVNLHWYYIYQRNWPAICAAKRRDMGVFIISPVNKGGMLDKAPEKLARLCRPLHPIVFNSLFCLAREEIHTLSLGASCPGDFDLQISTLDLLDDVDRHLAQPLARLRKAMVEAVGEEVADRYTEGLPPWDSTPGHVNIPTILWLRHLALAYDMVEYAKMRYNLLGNAAHWFPGLQAAHLEGLDFTKALEKSPFADEIPRWLEETHALLHRAPEKRLSQH